MPIIEALCGMPSQRAMFRGYFRLVIRLVVALVAKNIILRQICLGLVGVSLVLRSGTSKPTQTVSSVQLVVFCRVNTTNGTHGSIWMNTATKSILCSQRRVLGNFSKSALRFLAFFVRVWPFR
jgi:hypothetical protein